MAVYASSIATLSQEKLIPKLKTQNKAENYVEKAEMTNSVTTFWSNLEIFIK